MTYAELTRKLRQLGFEYRRNAKGSHEVWRHQANRVSVIIPHHGGRDIAPGTLRAILRKLDLTEEELRDV